MPMAGFTRAHAYVAPRSLRRVRQVVRLDHGFARGTLKAAKCNLLSGRFQGQAVQNRVGRTFDIAERTLNLRPARITTVSRSALVWLLPEPTPRMPFSPRSSPAISNTKLFSDCSRTAIVKGSWLQIANSRSALQEEARPPSAVHAVKICMIAALSPACSSQLV